MGQRYRSQYADYSDAAVPMLVDDAAAVHPDHDIITRHFEGPLTIGDFVSAFAEGAEGHGGLPTYLRITMHGDASRLRKLIVEKAPKSRGAKFTAH